MTVSPSPPLLPAVGAVEAQAGSPSPKVAPGVEGRQKPEVTKGTLYPASHARRLLTICFTNARMVMRAPSRIRNMGTGGGGHQGPPSSKIK